MGKKYLFKIICNFIRLCNYNNLIVKEYAKYLCSKIYWQPDVIRSSVGTIMLYNNVLSNLFSNGYNNFIEIGPGKLSIPAISILASFLQYKFTYYGVDKDKSILKEFNLFLHKLYLKYHIIIDTFDNTLLYNFNNSIICLEHALEDIILDTLHSQYGIFSAVALNDIKDELCKPSNYSFQDDMVSSLLEDIFSKLMVVCSNERNILIIHHYVTPYSTSDTYLWLLDKTIINWVDKFIHQNGKEYIKINFSPNFIDEIFWVGGF